MPMLDNGTGKKELRKAATLLREIRSSYEVSSGLSTELTFSLQPAHFRAPQPSAPEEGRPRRWDRFHSSRSQCQGPPQREPQLWGRRLPAVRPLLLAGRGQLEAQDEWLQTNKGRRLESELLKVVLLQ